MGDILSKVMTILVNAGGKILLALLVLVVGRIVIRAAMKIFDKAKFTEKLEPTVRNFLRNFLRILLYVILVISIISVLGVPMASVITVLASCGVAIGLALQGALSNVAGGVMILIFHPFVVGDYIVTGSGEGVVKEISLFYTTLNTIDNKRITLPNGSLMNASVVNVTAEDDRRVDLTFNISGAHEIEKVREVMTGVCEKNAMVISEPAAPFAAPLEGIPGGLKYVVRAWTKKENYWDVYFALMQEIPTALGEAGIGGPSTPVTVTQG